MPNPAWNDRIKRERRMRRMWNAGEASYAEIARAVGSTAEAVEAYLAQCPGFPGYVGPKKPCRICGVEFRGAIHGRGYCSQACKAEARRRAWWRSKARSRGEATDIVPPRRCWRGKPLSAGDRRVVRAARAEARERGVPIDAVLIEWKFEPEWRCAS